MCGGSDCRCKVSLQSYSPSNVELDLQNENFFEGAAVWVIFL